jgi:hypothetical protein
MIGGLCGLAADAENPPSAPAMLWNPDVPQPALAEIPFVDGVTNLTVHRAVKGEYQFLHGAGIIAHRGRLFACWANSPVNENSPQEIWRGRWSEDGGLTWGPPEIIAGGSSNAPAYGHGTLLSHQDRLWAFAARFGKAGVDKDTVFPGIRMEIFARDDTAGKWEARGLAAEDFWAQEALKSLPGGGWIVGGDDADSYPAVALIAKDDPAKWSVVKLPVAPTRKNVKYYETTLFVEPDGITAVIRNFKSWTEALALCSTSRDGGRTWTEATESNWRMAESRAYAGVLSTGQRYLLCNYINRDNLVIAVSRPGQKQLSRVWMIRKGKSAPPRYPGKAKGPQWSYPYAIEHQAKLYVVYSVGKEDCDLSIIPLPALKAD